MEVLFKRPLHTSRVPPAFFSNFYVSFEQMTATINQREADKQWIYPTFQGFLYLTHPPLQMIRPKATDSTVRTDRKVYQQRKQKDQSSSNQTVLFDIHQLHIQLLELMVSLYLENSEWRHSGTLTTQTAE